MRIGGFTRPFRGFTVSGDAFHVTERAADYLIGVIDGLGHGEESARAAKKAIEVLDLAGTATVEQLILRCHEAMRETRGAAVGLLTVDAEGRGSFCGVGNIEVQALHGESPSLFCSPGVVGHNLRRVRTQTFAMQGGDVYCMHSDGVSARGDFSTCLPGEPAEVARAIVEKFGRDHDDATALVLGFRAEFRFRPTVPTSTSRPLRPSVGMKL